MQRSRDTLTDARNVHLFSQSPPQSGDFVLECVDGRISRSADNAMARKGERDVSKWASSPPKHPPRPAHPFGYHANPLMPLAVCTRLFTIAFHLSRARVKFRQTCHLPVMCSPSVTCKTGMPERIGSSSASCVSSPPSHPSALRRNDPWGRLFTVGPGDREWLVVVGI
jgi:hypothetical protein